MDVKRFVLGCVAVYVASQVLGFVIHQVFLGETYASLANVWRPEAEMMAKMWMMYVTGAIWTVLFCYIFTRGYEGKGAMEGIRYGLLIGIFFGIPFSYESWVIYPITLGLAHAWAISTIAVCMVYGLVVALIYRPQPAVE
ncbi:MAG: hypothetical protein KAJ97_10875 [Acidobacteria bacterium]|nr:hypothetical protein [Acidobacteriota bacterium]